jgi:hypothetical protein
VRAATRRGSAGQRIIITMGGYIWGVGLALLAAIGVFAVANTASGGTGLRGFWNDFRSGLHRRRDDDAPLDDAPEPVDVPFDQMFAEVSQPDDGYLQLDELAGVLERTGERASRMREHLPQSRAASGPRSAPVRRGGHAPAGTVQAPPAVPPQRSDG